MKSIKRLAICNRGEVAVRIVEACREMGIVSVLIHSEADVQSRAYRMADECVNLGGNTPAESYLDISKNVQAAKSAFCDAVHPGFGFLSENADFAEAVMAAKMIFVGPMPDSIRKMGDKISAKALMEEAKVPTVPGYKGEDQSYPTLLKNAQAIGFPVLIKAAAGGGGRGMKVSRSKEDFQEQLDSAKREAKTAFGSEVVFLEKYLEDTKHIEFQVFGDRYGNVVHLFERECSIQRRHQKIIEEAPSPSLSVELRARMAEAAVRAAQKIHYVGAGTVEFLLKGKEFYFLEMNTRLQVEHPVTEFITGCDLVKAQIAVAQGENLPWNQSEIQVTGHSIECRLYAEDPYHKGVPSTGELLYQEFPYGPGRRFDFGFESGDMITSYYDPMIGKLIAWSETRYACIERMQSLLSQTLIFGVKTNIEFLKAILKHHDFISGGMSTSFIERYFPNALEEGEITEEAIEIAKKLMSIAKNANLAKGDIATLQSPWDGSWRNV